MVYCKNFYQQSVMQAGIANAPKGGCWNPSIGTGLYKGWFDLNNSLVTFLRNRSCVVGAALWGMVSLELPTLVKVAWKSMAIYFRSASAYGFDERIEGSDKTPVLLLHGAAGTWNYMGDLANKLKEEGIPVFVINLGSGGASNESREAVHSKIRQIQEIYTASGLSQPKVDIVAHSMGGTIAFASAFSATCSTIDANGSLEWIEGSSPLAAQGIRKVVTLALPTDAEELAKLEKISKVEDVYNITAKYDLLVGHKLSGLNVDHVSEVETTHVEIVYDKNAQNVLLGYLS